MGDSTYRVSLEKEQLVFSAAHFITFAGNICERLHGHNYRVKCEVHGALDENEYVVDFIALRDTLAAIVGDLDHRMLLPTNHPTIRVTRTGDEVVVTFEQKRWVFPTDDCVLLPIANTTAELLASYIGQQLLSRMEPQHLATTDKIVIWVDENHGQWAVCEKDVPRH